MPSPETDDPDVAAAELALGVLDGEERAVALRRLLAEPDFAREVERWRARFATLFAQWPAVEVPDGWKRIETELWARVPVPRGMRIWQGVAVASTMLAASLLALLFRPEPAPPPVSAPAPLVAALAPTDKSPPLAAVYDSAAGEVRVASTSLAPQGRVAQLWAIAGDGVPHSLGLLRSGAATTVRITAENRTRMTPGTTLAVSVEPLGGSPKAVPTGPVVATGALSRV